VVQVELSNMHVNIGANSGSDKLWTNKKKNTSNPSLQKYPRA